ncbi:myb/SANT-like DNA-binding domain-containing protein 7 [Nothobranchius furzeri]|uniref:Pyrroline-5-carboxylate reductase-like n=1 Tax=Nothobranchius furzeri TaxID=105023 RepID=A0A1A8B7C7_NOTFU|nr:zinc finger and SCAN domain-containing protein 29-like [Nothobranchius furzeri]
MAGKTSARSQHFWTDEETEFMLNQLKELNIFKFMDGRKTRNGELFKTVQEQMASAGYTRTPEQIRVRWKHVKHAFLNARKNNSTSVHAPVTSSFSAALEELLEHRSMTQAGEHGVDVGFAPVSESTSERDLVDGTMEEATPSSSGSSEQKRPTSPALQHRTSTPARRSGRRGQRRVAPEVGEFLDRLEDMQKGWMEAIRESQDREERLVNSIIESNAAVVASLMEGIRSFRCYTKSANPSHFVTPGASVEPSCVCTPQTGIKEEEEDDTLKP